MILKNGKTARTVPERRLGFLTAACGSYYRWKAGAEKRSSEPQSNHIGEVGQKVGKEIDPRDIELVLVKHLHNDWGVTTLLKMADEGGNVCTWFASGFYDLSVGDKGRLIRGTVKKTGEFQGQKQTTLSRCKIEWEAA